jgi:hypothetical protein
MITIFGDFRQFWANFENFGRFSPIFGDFHQFSAKTLAFFLNNQCYDSFIAKNSILNGKRHFFKFIWRTYFQNHNIGPWINFFPPGISESVPRFLDTGCSTTSTKKHHLPTLSLHRTPKPIPSASLHTVRIGSNLVARRRATRSDTKITVLVNRSLKTCYYGVRTS